MSTKTLSSDQAHLARVKNSALWAAWGDAVGFVAELTDKAGLEHRTRGKALAGPVPWRRRIGGRGGASVELPAGAISDDTQLRLATSRSLRPSGAFDLETFSKVELTVWPTYALGAGRGSLTAATNLRKRATNWSTNFFSERGIEYLNAGGNGAAMRIQPHVWASADAHQESWLAPVIENSIVTHGHPRGFVGAAFHAGCLASAMRNAKIPGPEEWLQVAKDLEAIPKTVAADTNLTDIWLRQWEKRGKRSLDEAVSETLSELREDLELCAGVSPKSSPQGRYAEAVEALGAFEPKQRGSGIKTVALAALAAHQLADSLQEAVLIPARALGTDTDTIATMAGALVGVVVPESPPTPLPDAEYIGVEATRVAGLALGGRPAQFPYPDLLNWTPPKAAIDAIGDVEGESQLAGLGPAAADGDQSYEGSGKAAGIWRWRRLWFGQQVLAKERQRPKALAQSQRVVPSSTYAQADLETMQRATEERAPSRSKDAELRALPGSRRSVHEVTDAVIKAGLTDEAIGLGFREVAEGRTAIEDARDYSAIIAKALVTRAARQTKKS